MLLKLELYSQSQVQFQYTALPDRATVQGQLAQLLTGMDDGEVPAWARPGRLPRRPGAPCRTLRAGNGGTLFLDEIGDIPLPLQVKLLRFLQEHEIQRLGGKDSIVVDARIIAATHVDLQSAIGSGRFREDLYYRLCVITIPMPRLSERRADIPLLARAFLRRFAEEQRKPLAGFTPEAMAALTAHHWPGNVREVENRIKRAVLMAEGKDVTPSNLGTAPQPCWKRRRHRKHG